MKKLLVTGAGGFLGSALLKLTELKKHEIIAVTSGRRKLELSDGIHEIVTDLLDPKSREELICYEKPDVLLHLAWGKQDGVDRNADSNIEWLEASLHLLRCFVDNGGKRFVFAGSSAEYEDDCGLSQEKTEKAIMSMYGQTKKAFSDVAKNYCMRVGVEFVDVRLFTLYGMNDQHRFGAIPLCIKTLLENKNFICTAPNTIRDYVYVDDAAKALVKVVNSNYCGIVNVSSGQPRAMREIFCFIAKELNKEHLLIFHNEDKCELILAGDNKILNNIVGFKDFTTFEDGMRKTISWWLNHN